MAKKPKTETVDFSGVPEEKSQRSRHIPEGDYLAKIISTEKKWKDNDRSNPAYFNWKLQINAGKYKGTPIYLTTSLKPEALFNLRNLIMAATGRNLAGKRVNFDPNKLIGKVIAISVEDNEYEDKKGKSRLGSSVADTRPKEELHDDEEDEDEDEADEEDEDEEEDDDDEEEEEDEELEEVDVEDL